ncbi:MAG: peroxidase-related enzyme [Halobacteriales archaeon]
MALLDYVDPETADEETRALLADDADTYGRPSLFGRLMAREPDVLDARNEYYGRLVDGGSLPRRVGELVYLAVSVTNDCEYCIASHRELLVERVGLPSRDADAVARGEFDGFDERERAALSFARQVALDPGGVDEADVDALRAAGFDDGDVVRLTAIAGAALAANAFADAMGIEPSDRPEPFSG